MTDDQIARICEELLREYPGARIKVAPGGAEIIAELDPRRAVAVIERTAPHFHRRTTESYRALRGTLYVVCGGQGHVLAPGESLRIDPPLLHSARAADGVAWIEVLSDPMWTADDHLVV